MSCDTKTRVSRHFYNSADEQHLLPSSSVPCTEESVRYSSKNPGDGRCVHGVHQPPPGHGSQNSQFRLLSESSKLHSMLSVLL